MGKSLRWFFEILTSFYVAVMSCTVDLNSSCTMCMVDQFAVIFCSTVGGKCWSHDCIECVI
jgi:hypothetical protein